MKPSLCRHQRDVRAPFFGAGDHALGLLFAAARDARHEDLPDAGIFADPSEPRVSLRRSARSERHAADGIGLDRDDVGAAERLAFGVERAYQHAGAALRPRRGCGRSPLLARCSRGGANGTTAVEVGHPRQEKSIRLGQDGQVGDAFAFGERAQFRRTRKSGRAARTRRWTACAAPAPAGATGTAGSSRRSPELRLLGRRFDGRAARTDSVEGDDQRSHRPPIA